MPFKRCARCGKEFLARDDSVDVCSPACSGPVTREAAPPPGTDGGRWWAFPLFFLACCALTLYCYINAYDVELFVMRNLPFLRDTMAAKLAEGCPDSLDQILDAVADEDVDVACSCLYALAKHGRSLPSDDERVLDFIEELKQINEDPEETLELKKAAVAAMGLVDDPAVVELLYRALSDKRLVYGAVVAMQKVGTERAIEPLVDIVMDKYGDYETGDIRYQAVIALGRIEDREGAALPALIKALRDPSGAVRDEAVKAIDAIGQRYDKLDMRGRERLRKAAAAIKLYTKADRIVAIRDRGADTYRRLMAKIR